MIKIKKYFWILFFVAIIIGSFFNQFSKLSFMLPYIVGFVLFLNFLKIDFNSFFGHVKKPFLIIYISLLVLVISPLLVYFAFYFLKTDFLIAFVLLAAMPAGMSVPVYSSIMKGDFELSVAVLLVTSLICPITIPLIISLLFGLQANVSFFQIFSSLSIVILIPFILSLIFRKTLPKTIEKTKEHFTSICILLISFIIVIAVSRVNFIQAISNRSVILPFILLFVLAALLHALGFFLVRSKPITASLSVAYMNSTLAILVAASFFSSETLLLVTLYQLPTNIVLTIFSFLIRNKADTSNRTTSST